MQTYLTRPASIEAFVEMIREGLPTLIEEGTDHAVVQVGDEGLLAWTANGEDAFAIALSNGSRYQFTVRQLQPPAETDMYCEGCGTLSDVETLDADGNCLLCQPGTRS